MAGLDDLVNKAKDLISGDKEAGSEESIVDKVKGLATDERIDQVSEAIQKVTPDSVDGAVQNIADKAKGLN